MRVLLSSTRGAGHLQPLLPYARALRAHGHDVLVAGPADIATTLREAELAHAPFDHPGDDTLAPIWARLRQVPPAEAARIVVREIFAGVNARVAIPKLLETIEAWRPDVILRDSVEFGAVVAAERAGVPHVRVAVHMVSFEEDIPALAAEPLDHLRRAAGLPPDAAACVRAEAVFCAFPASLDGASADNGQQPVPFRVRVVDDATPAAPASWAAPDDGRPLIYVTFGTIAGTSSDVHSVYRTALDAIADLPVRALLTTGRGMEAGKLGAIPGNVHVEQWVPQRDVFAHAAALVCHGGSGTVCGSLAAGIPMVVVPLFADQPHNARRVAAVGAGIALPGPDTASLSAAVARVLADAAFGAGARRIATDIAALPPVEAAVPVLAAMAV